MTKEDSIYGAIMIGLSAVVMLMFIQALSDQADARFPSQLQVLDKQLQTHKHCRMRYRCDHTPKHTRQVSDWDCDANVNPPNDSGICALSHSCGKVFHCQYYCWHEWRAYIRFHLTACPDNAWCFRDDSMQWWAGWHSFSNLEQLELFWNESEMQGVLVYPYSSPGGDSAVEVSIATNSTWTRLTAPKAKNAYPC